MIELGSQKRGISLFEIATFITTMTAVPGVVVNAYWDYRERADSILIQKSSHDNVSEAVDTLASDLATCSADIKSLQTEIDELRHMIEPKLGNLPRKDSIVPTPSEVALEKRASMVKPQMLNFDAIVKHVKTTGKVYQVALDEQVTQ
jgi:hypothetical protein